MHTVAQQGRNPKGIRHTPRHTVVILCKPKRSCSTKWSQPQARPHRRLRDTTTAVTRNPPPPALKTYHHNTPLQRSSSPACTQPCMQKPHPQRSRCMAAVTHSVAVQTAHRKSWRLLQLILLVLIIILQGSLGGLALVLIILHKATTAEGVCSTSADRSRCGSTQQPAAQAPPATGTVQPLCVSPAQGKSVGAAIEPCPSPTDSSPISRQGLAAPG
jgi:hypothetical protein